MYNVSRNQVLSTRPWS